MDNRTGMVIERPAQDIFDAIVNPSKIGAFWFSSSSQPWQTGRIITLVYEEYDARGEILVLDMIEGQKICFGWGKDGQGNEVTITLVPVGRASTRVEVVERGFEEGHADVLRAMLDNKEGWVYMLSCLKAYLEFGVTALRGALVKG